MSKTSKATDVQTYIRERRLFTTHYLYLDKSPYIADRIFYDIRLSVHFIEEYKSATLGYSLIHVWIWGWREKDFEDCMARLYKTSLLMDRDDYMQACNLLEGIAEKNMI